MRRLQRGRWTWWLAASVAALGATAWVVTDASSSGGGAASSPLAGAGAVSPGALASRTNAASASAPTAGGPFSAAGLLARQEQRLLWQDRLERSKAALEAYQQSTRYPHSSQPASEHPDQLHPNEVITSEHALLKPDGKAATGV